MRLSFSITLYALSFLVLGSIFCFIFYILTKVNKSKKISFSENVVSPEVSIDSISGDSKELNKEESNKVSTKEDDLKNKFLTVNTSLDSASKVDKFTELADVSNVKSSDTSMKSKIQFTSDGSTAPDVSYRIKENIPKRNAENKLTSNKLMFENTAQKLHEDRGVKFICEAKDFKDRIKENFPMGHIGQNSLGIVPKDEKEKSANSYRDHSENKIKSDTSNIDKNHTNARCIIYETEAFKNNIQKIDQNSLVMVITDEKEKSMNACRARLESKTINSDTSSDSDIERIDEKVNSIDDFIVSEFIKISCAENESMLKKIQDILSKQNDSKEIVCPKLMNAYSSYNDFSVSEFIESLLPTYDSKEFSRPFNNQNSSFRRLVNLLENEKCPEEQKNIIGEFSVRLKEFFLLQNAVLFKHEGKNKQKEKEVPRREGRRTVGANKTKEAAGYDSQIHSDSYDADNAGSEKIADQVSNNTAADRSQENSEVIVKPNSSKSGDKVESTSVNTPAPKPKDADSGIATGSTQSSNASCESDSSAKRASSKVYDNENEPINISADKSNVVKHAKNVDINIETGSHQSINTLHDSDISSECRNLSRGCSNDSGNSSLNNQVNNEFIPTNLSEILDCKECSKQSEARGLVYSM